MDNNLQIGEKLRLLREKLNFTQQSVADYLNIKRENLSYYETGTREIPLDLLEKLCLLYGIDLESIINDDSNVFEASLAFAFRADEMGSSDLSSIARFKEIVMNYIKMNQLASKI
jgi:transcriptional regulator with XRE-family HTH domain